MNIGNVSMALAQSSSLSDVGTAVLGKSLETAEQNGNGLLKMFPLNIINTNNIYIIPIKPS